MATAFTILVNYSSIFSFFSLFIFFLQPLILVSANCSVKYQYASNQTRTFENCVDLGTQGAMLGYTYFPNSSNVDFVFSGEFISPSGWVGWGINPTAPHQMVGARVLIAFHDPTTTDPILLPYVLSPSVRSQRSSLVSTTFHTPNITSSPVFTSGSKVNIFASIALSESQTTIHHVWNRGQYVQGYSPTVHPTSPPDLATTRAIDVRGSNSSKNSKTNFTTRLKTAHGLLNCLSWGFLLVLGAATARYLRHLPQAQTTWFHVHVAFQLMGYALGAAGWATGMRLGSLSDGIVHVMHRKLGISVFSLGTLQMVAMFFKPKKTNKFRRYWKSYHHLVGYGCVVVGVVNVFQGFDVMQLSAGSPAKMAYCLVLAAIVGICIAMEVISWLVFIRSNVQESLSEGSTELDEKDGTHAF